MKILKQNDINLLLVLLFYTFLPTLYTTVRINLLGYYNVDTLTIASQIQWLNVMYEVLQEALIIPAYFFINNTNNGTVSKIDRIRNVFLLILITHIIMFCFVCLCSNHLVLLMKQNDLLILETSYYLKLEAFALIFEAIFKFCIVVYIIEKQITQILFLTILKLLLTVIFDISFLYKYITGANGIAYSNILSNIILVCYSIFHFTKINIHIFRIKVFTILSVKTMYLYFISIGRVMIISGLESALRNIIFIYIILRMVNSLKEQGVFWLSINFIWMWLLFPIIQLGEIIKNDISKNINNIKSSYKFYLLITTIFIILWIIGIPFYKLFFKYVFNSKDYDAIYNIVIVSIPFYILFAYGNIITNIFYGLGKPEYIFLQSFIINIIYYGIFFVLYQKGIYSLSLNNIILLFGGSMACGTLINFILYYTYISKYHKCIT